MVVPTPRKPPGSPDSSLAHSGMKRQRDPSSTSSANPKFNSTNIIRTSVIHHTNSPAPKVRRIEPPECQRESCRIRIKNEKFLLETSSSSDSSDEPANNTPPNMVPISRSGSNYSNSSSDLNSRSPKWNCFGTNVAFTSTPSRNRHPSSRSPTMSPPGPPPFCFHCKTFGHTRFVCHFSWNYWWPKQMLNKHPWLPRRIWHLKQIRLERRQDYQQCALQLDREVEIADEALSRNHNADYNQNSTRYWKPRRNRQSAARASRERIFSRPNRTMVYPHDQQYLLPTDFSRQQLMENIQLQINDLQRSLHFLRTQRNF